MTPVFALLFTFVALSTCTFHPPYWTLISQTGAVPAPITDAGAAYVNGFGFFVFGGLNGSASDFTDDPVNTLHLFNPSTGVWTDLSGYANGPGPRAETMVWPTSTGVIVSGGRGPFRRGVDWTYNDTYQFVVNGGWVNLGQTLQANRSTEAAVEIKKGVSTAYAFSGSASTLSRFVNRDGGLRTDIVSYTPSNGWETVDVKHNSPIPTPRAHHCLVASPDGKSLFTYGGYTKDSSGGNEVFGEVNYLGDLWEFKTRSSKWEQHTWTGANPGKRDNSKLFYDEENDRLWLVGGSDWVGPVNDVWFYSFKTATWTDVTPYLVDGVKPSARQGPMFFERAFDDRIEFWYFAGGSGEFGTPLNDMWRLTVPLDFTI